tara:strand:- start:58661 stop:59038 length:378 start_codon:yes stop_codon:yes gene_type:complete
VKAKGNFIQQRLKSFKYAFKGFKLLLLKEGNFQVQFLVAIIAIVLGFVFDISSTEWMIQLGAIGLVLVAEGLNTSIEKLADFVHKENHPKIGVVKDISAGACLIASCIGLAIGLILYLPKIAMIL